MNTREQLFSVLYDELKMISSMVQACIKSKALSDINKYKEKADQIANLALTFCKKGFLSDKQYKLLYWTVYDITVNEVDITKFASIQATAALMRRR